jgi:hypothetical protein
MPQKASGCLGCHSYVIVDDLISSGSTIERIVESIEKEAEYIGMKIIPRPVAIALYFDSGGFVHGGQSANRSYLLKKNPKRWDIPVYTTEDAPSPAQNALETALLSYG